MTSFAGPLLASTPQGAQRLSPGWLGQGNPMLQGMQGMGIGFGIGMGTFGWQPLAQGAQHSPQVAPAQATATTQGFMASTPVAHVGGCGPGAEGLGGAVQGSDGVAEVEVEVGLGVGVGSQEVRATREGEGAVGADKDTGGHEFGGEDKNVNENEVSQLDASAPSSGDLSAFLGLRGFASGGTRESTKASVTGVSLEVDSGGGESLVSPLFGVNGVRLPTLPGFSPSNFLSTPTSCHNNPLASLLSGTTHGPSSATGIAGNAVGHDATGADVHASMTPSLPDTDAMAMDGSGDKGAVCKVEDWGVGAEGPVGKPEAAGDEGSKGVGRKRQLTLRGGGREGVRGGSNKKRPPPLSFAVGAIGGAVS